MSLHGHVGTDENGSKVFLPLENNPLILNPLAHTLGLNPGLAFHDLYSFSDPDLIALVPRPALALLFVWPHTPGAGRWHRDSVVEEMRIRASKAQDEAGVGKEVNKVLWFRQDVRNCCGLMGLIHCTLNIPPALIDLLPPPSPAASSSSSAFDSTPSPSAILGNPSTLSVLQTTALDNYPTSSPDHIAARANLIVQSAELETAHAQAATRGSTKPLALGEDPGHAFIAFVKDRDGGLWEMDGSRTGPRFLGTIRQDEDLLSEAALKLGPLPYVEREAARAADTGATDGVDEGVGHAGVRAVNFSCTVLAPAGASSGLS